MTRRAWVLMSVLAATWGASYLFIKVGLRDFSAGVIVCGRTLLAAAVMLPVAHRQGALAKLRGRMGPIVVLAVVQVVAPFLLITLGEHHVASSMAGILVAAAPIWTAILAMRLDHDERSHGAALAGIVVGMIGVVLLFGVDLSGDAKTLLSGLMILVAALGYSLGALYLKRRLAGIPAAAVAGSTMAVSALITLPVALADLPHAAGADSVSALLALGAIGTGIAFLIFYTLIADVGPARASIVAYLAPGFAVLYGVAVLDESITLGTVAGLVLILAGSWLGAEGRVPARLAGLRRSEPSRSTSRAPERAR